MDKYELEEQMIEDVRGLDYKIDCLKNSNSINHWNTRKNEDGNKV